MTRKIPIVVLFVLAVLPPGVVGAQEMSGMPAASCTKPAELPAALAGWTAKTPLASATDASRMDAAMLAIGQGASVTLHPTREVHYVSQPEKPGGSVAHGGMVAVAISASGTYQVSLNSSAWVDVLKDGTAVISSAHAPGPACTGIRKTVRFSLTPGRYAIQLSANAAPTIAVMVSQVP
jgi:hypothetical protein